MGRSCLIVLLGAGIGAGCLEVKDRGSSDAAVSADAATEVAHADNRPANPGLPDGGFDPSHIDADVPGAIDVGLPPSSDTGAPPGPEVGSPEVAADVPAATDTASPPNPDTAPPANQAGVFVAQGLLGRTTISCDDGQTWVGNRSDGDTLRCDVGIDCDHTSGTGRGIAFGNGWFVATFGWGQLGAIRRSRDGVNWSNVTNNTTFGGLVFGQNVFLAGHNPAAVSDAEGGTWHDAPGPQFEGSARRVAFLPHEGGRFVISADNELVLSSDAGATWWRPTSRPPECLADMVAGGMAYASGVMMLVKPNGVACSSSDGGVTWTTSTMPGSVNSRLVVAGSDVVAFGPSGMFRSSDGRNWRVQQTTPPGVPVGAVAINPETGTFVGVRLHPYYDQQTFHRSRNGVEWETLPAGRFVPSHPIINIAYGRVPRPDACR